jgi:transcriptional regulator with XRE-family HTH domain
MERAKIQTRMGQRLRELRVARSLTQEALAQLAEVDRGFISEMETGDRNPSVWVIYRLARALAVDPGQLLPPNED